MPDPKLQTMDRILAAAAPARDLANGKTTLTRLIARRIMRNPLRALGWCLAGGAAFAVFANIMLLQPERHRAPMFVGNPLIHDTPVPTEVPLPPQRPGVADKDAEAMRRADLMRDIQIELGRRGYFIGETDVNAADKTAKAIREFQAAARLPVNGQPTDALLATILTSNLRVKDQIAGLLRNTGDRLERPDTVVAIQRALTKLGYGPLRDDGNFGVSTRAALDKFGRDRKLPSHADQPARVLKELAQTSGIAID